MRTHAKVHCSHSLGKVKVFPAMGCIPERHVPVTQSRHLVTDGKMVQHRTAGTTARSGLLGPMLLNDIGQSLLQRMCMPLIFIERVDRGDDANRSQSWLVRQSIRFLTAIDDSNDELDRRAGAADLAAFAILARCHDQSFSGSSYA